MYLPWAVAIHGDIACQMAFGDMASNVWKHDYTFCDSGSAVQCIEATSGMTDGT